MKISNPQRPPRFLAKTRAIRASVCVLGTFTIIAGVPQPLLSAYFQPHSSLVASSLGQAFFSEIPELKSADARQSSPAIQRFFNGEFVNQDLGFGNGWISNLHLRLRPAGVGYVSIRRPQGDALLKIIDADDVRYKTGGIKKNSKIILRTGQFLQWTNLSGVTYRFKGSLPVQMEYPDGSIETLHYENNRLKTIRNQQSQSTRIFYKSNTSRIKFIQSSNGARIHFNYDNGYLTSSEPEQTKQPLSTNPASGKRHYRYKIDDAVPPIHRSNTLTGSAYATNQSDAFAPDSAILLDTTRLPSTFIDIRPPGCNSYFDLPNAIVRGREIEAAMSDTDRYRNALATNRWFPAIDFVVGRTAVAQISRDIALPSYNNPDNSRALLNRLMREGRMIDQRFIQPLAANGQVTATAQGATTTVTSDQIDHVRFELIVQRGQLQPHHLVQIEQARSRLATRFNIQLEIVSIP